VPREVLRTHGSPLVNALLERGTQVAERDHADEAVVPVGHDETV